MWTIIHLNLSIEYDLLNYIISIVHTKLLLKVMHYNIALLPKK